MLALFSDIFADPSKDTPAIVLALASLVAVAALPVHEPDEPEALPVTLPVTAVSYTHLTLPTKSGV